MLVRRPKVKQAAIKTALIFSKNCFKRHKMSLELSKGALEIIMNGGRIHEPTLQVLGSKKMNSTINNSERFRILLSDGEFQVNVGMYTITTKSQEEYNAMELYAIIKLKRYITNVVSGKDKKDKRLLLIFELELLKKGSRVGHQIGKPTDFLENNSQYSDIENSANNSAVVGLTSTLNYTPEGISPISSLNPFHNNWTIKARIVAKTNIRNWSNAKGEGKLFSVDLVDKWGEIRCTAFRDLVDKFYDVLQVDKVYLIRNCLLQPINPKFCSLNHHYEMSFVEQSVVEEVQNDLSIPEVKYNFITIDKISAMVANTVVDLVAICKSSSELQEFTSKLTNRELKKREVLLVDQSKSAISLVLWGETAENFEVPELSVISLRNVRIQEFQGSKSLSLNVGSQLNVNPKIPERQQLYNWYEREGYQIEFNNMSARSLGSGVYQWCNFKEMTDQNLSQGFSFQTYATILFARLDRCVYQSCPTSDCQKKVLDLENGMYKCEKCNREYSSFKYRLLFSMNISDVSGSQWVTVFSSDAENLLGKTADEVGRAIKDDPEIVTQWSEKLQFKQFVFKCRAKIENYNDEEKTRVIVVGLRDLNYEEDNNFLIKKIEGLSGVALN